MGNLLRKLGMSLLVSTFISPLMAQENRDLYNLSIEELMNIAIVSASSQEETLFEAPVSSYSITKEEISKAGITSIPEALRLCPGVIVRETTNGNYDVHINGFDNPIKYTHTVSQMNMLTLVMINNRPVFSLGQGGTHWEALPVDLIDVERIEIVRGPSAPLFGPNAVTGVINIITKTFDSENWYASANIQHVAPLARIGNVAVGKKISKKINVALSGNYQLRDRNDHLYYNYESGSYINSKDYRAEEEYKHEIAMDKYGINGYLNYEANKDINVNISAGTQHSDVQKVHFSTEIPLSFTEKESSYINFAGKAYGVNTRISYEFGEHHLLKEKNPLYSAAYYYHTLDATADYQWKINSRFHLRPALNYMQSQYDGSEFAKKAPAGGAFDGNFRINSAGISLRSDWYPVEGLRVVAGVRGDKFTVKDDPALSYQFLTTYNVNDKWLFRLVQSNSKSGVFFQQILDLTIPTPMPDGNMLMFNINADPNDSKVVSNTMTEVGIRSKVTKSLQLDLSLFSQKLTNLYELQMTDGGVSETGVPYIDNQYLNLPFESKQYGMTFSANYVPDTKWQIKPFITLQSTETENFYYYANPAAKKETRKHESTPTVYGGLFANYAPTKALNINMNSYFFGNHTMYHHQNALSGITSENQIRTKVLINTKISYQVYRNAKAYIGGRNLLNQNTREYYGTDRIGRNVFAGASYNF